MDAFQSTKQECGSVGVYWLTGMKEMMEDPLPGTWNITFMNEWVSVRDARLPDGDPVRLD